MTTGGLAEVLRHAQTLLRPVRTRLPAAHQALEVLERDLLPRTAGGDVYVVAGIVGPNNAGKSALFNALVGTDLSPSVPSGGATRRLVGAAHPTLLERLGAEPTLARFQLRSFGANNAGEVFQPAPDPAELLVAAEAQLPAELMLIDTPDFDSILADNRLASESLLAVADLVIAVVTRHSYQNKEVVRFLEQWLDHGRPWLLVYNEASGEAVARAHAEKLAADVGTPPVAAFWAAHSLAVQRQETALDPHRLSLDGAPPAPSGGVSDRRRLRDLLFDLDEIGELKARAFAAALHRLRDAVAAVTVALTADATHARSLLEVCDEQAYAAGVQVASAAMPARPFVEAFRTVLDRRTNPLSRSWRVMLRRARHALESLPALFRARTRVADSEEAALATLASIEQEQLRAAWPSFWETLVRDVGQEARHPARQAASTAVGAWFDHDFGTGDGTAALGRATAALGAQPPDVTGFRQACEELVEDAIVQRGFDLDIQAAADLTTMMPLAVAAAVIIKTGGLGSDLAVAGGGAVGTFLFEKYAHLLGGGIVGAARRRWAQLRGRVVARLLIDAALPEAAPKLRAAVETDSSVAAELRQVSVRLQ